MKRTATIAAGAVLLAIALTGCGKPSSWFDKATEPYQDAKIGTKDKTAAKVIEMPDGFSNLATKCVGGVRYTVSYKGDANRTAIATVLDPACK